MVNAAVTPAALRAASPAPLAASAPRLWLHGDGPLSGLLAEALCAAGAAVHAHAPQANAGAGADAEAACTTAAGALDGLDALVCVADPLPVAATADAVVTAALVATQRLLGSAKAATGHWTRARTPGSIVVVCDIAGLCGREGLAASAAASGALLGMARSLAKELGRRQIAVNAVCHGFVAGLDTGSALNGAEQRLFGAMGLGKPVTAAMLAADVLFLAGGGHGLTGQVLHADDGLVI